MNALPQSSALHRSPRVKLAGTPAVLRLPNGRSDHGELQTISLTGGLLSLSRLVDPGSLVKLMFVTEGGAVLGAAEMLRPVSWTDQPFRFVGLGVSDQRNLRATIQSALGPAALDEDWIERYRANVAHRKAPGRKSFGTILVALAISILCLGSAVYLCGIHLK
jgi:hypothetical protein